MKIFSSLIFILFVIFTLFFFTESEFEKDMKNNWKPILKKIQEKTLGKIYQKAEEHNPAGDVLPDQIDDKIKKEAKELIDKL